MPTNLLKAAASLPPEVRAKVREAESAGDRLPITAPVRPVADAPEMARRFLAGDPDWADNYGMPRGDTELRRLAAVHDAVEDLDDSDFDPRADLHAEDGAHLRRATYDEVAESCAGCAPGADDTVRGAPIDVGGVKCYAVLHVCGGDM